MSPQSSGSNAENQNESGSNAACSSETSVDFQRITRRYIPEDEVLVKLLVYYCSYLQKKQDA
jgi:hypothetical protein